MTIESEADAVLELLRDCGPRAQQLFTRDQLTKVATLIIELRGRLAATDAELEYLRAALHNVGVQP